ncbi:MAG: NAD(P)H-dependent oxidoreductase, partial [Sphingopyxis sp.]|nr:NAD(P)H-dependent oxidoreductase [Sphingopyxis sp.]
MRTLLIVWHSRTGTAEQLAHAAAQGALASDAARAGDVAVRMTDAASATAADLLDADGYIFACPENLASMSGMMKEMVDRCYYPLLGRIEGRPWALIIAAGTDGEGAARQWQRIATGWRLKAIADPMIVRTGADTPETILADKQLADEPLAQARDLGAA